MLYALLLIVLIVLTLALFVAVMLQPSQPEPEDNPGRIVYTQAGKVTRHGLMKR